MSDPLDDLFAAGRNEAPSAAAKAKAKAALGLGGAAAGGLATGAIVKLAGVVLIAGGAFLGGMMFSSSQRPQIAPIVVVTPPPPPPPPPPAPVAVEPPKPEPVIVPEPVKLPPKPAAVVEEDSLTRELAALDRARTKLKSGDATGALKELAAYEKAFPKGSLGTEAALVRIEALLKAGQRAEAEKLGASILEKPGPELVKQRVRRLLDAP